MDWKTDTTLGELAPRTPLLIRVLGRWEPTTPYELLNGYRFPRFLTIDQIEFTMDTEIKKGLASEEHKAILREIVLEDVASGTRPRPTKSRQLLAGFGRQYSDARNMVRTRHVAASSAGLAEPNSMAGS